MADVSLIFGSGLSIPAGFPSASELNSRLSKIDASEISIHTDGSAWFLKGQTDPNAHWMRVKERTFIQNFLVLYNSEVLKGQNNFDYEEFYDYYQQLKSSGNYSSSMNDLFPKYIEGEVTDADKNQLLFEFNMYFNQLIENLLFKKFHRGHICEPYSENFRALLLLLEKLGNKYTVNMHTLNHDLYIEHLSVSDSIKAEMDDGFEELGSPFYGESFNDYARYYVRLSRFTDKYTKRFRLFKLHGSIDHYWFGHEKEFDLIKLKYGISQNDIYKEIVEGSEKKYYHGTIEVYPDFLSGKEYKINKYSKGSYYPKVFEHFVKNLENSNSLVIIGYGFRDEEINNHISTYLQNHSKNIFVVDITKPNNSILENENVFFIDGGVVNMNYEYIINNVL